MKKYAVFTYKGGSLKGRRTHFAYDSAEDLKRIEEQRPDLELLEDGLSSRGATGLCVDFIPGI